MKNQALFSSKDKSEKLKCRLLHFLFGALRVNTIDSLYLDHQFLNVFSYIKEYSSNILAIFLHISNSVTSNY